MAQWTVGLHMSPRGALIILTDEEMELIMEREESS